MWMSKQIHLEHLHQNNVGIIQSVMIHDDTASEVYGWISILCYRGVPDLCYQCALCMFLLPYTYILHVY